MLENIKIFQDILGSYTRTKYTMWLAIKEYFCRKKLKIKRRKLATKIIMQKLDIRQIFMIQHDLRTIMRLLLSRQQRNLIRFQHDRLITLNTNLKKKYSSSEFSDHDYFGKDGGKRFFQVAKDLNQCSEIDRKLLKGILLDDEKKDKKKQLNIHMPMMTYEQNQYQSNNQLIYERPSL